MSAKKFRSNTVRILQTSLASLALTALTACGGGGGGGGGGEGTDTGSEFGVRVMHASIEAAPVEVISDRDLTAVVAGGMFATPSLYQSVQSGPQTLRLVRAKSPDRIFATESLMVSPRGRYSYLLFGDSSVFGLEARILSDDVPADFSGGLVRIVHGATGASSVSASLTPAIDGAGAVQVAYGSASSYVQVPAGVVQVAVSRTVDGRTLTTQSIAVENGRAYTLLVAGEVGYYTKGVLYADN